MKSSSNTCYLVDTTLYHHHHRTTVKTDGGVKMKGREGEGDSCFYTTSSSFSSSTYSLVDLLFNNKGCTSNNCNKNNSNNEKSLVEITLVSDNALRPSDDLLDYLRLELNPNSDRAITSTMSTSTDHFSTTSLLCSESSIDCEEDDEEYGYDSFYYDSVSTLGITPSPNTTPKTRNGTVVRSPLSTSSFMKSISSSSSNDSLDCNSSSNNKTEERSPTPIPYTSATTNCLQEQEQGNKVATAEQQSPSSRWCDNYQIVGADHQPIPHRPPIHSPYISTGTKKFVNFSTGATTTSTRGRLPPPQCSNKIASPPWKRAPLMLSPMIENSSQEVDSNLLDTPLPPPPPIDDSPMDDKNDYNTRRSRNVPLRHYSNDSMELHSILERSLNIAKGSK